MLVFIIVLCFKRLRSLKQFFSAIEGTSPATARTLLSYGADPLLHDYSGNMPLDLSANDPTMQLYVTNLLADLHGKTPAPAMRSSTSCSPPVRWNVSHCPEFHQPGPGILSLEDEKKAASKSNIEAWPRHKVQVQRRSISHNFVYTPTNHQPRSVEYSYTHYI